MTPILAHILLLLMIVHGLCFASGKIYTSKHKLYKSNQNHNLNEISLSSSSSTVLTVSPSSSSSFDEYDSNNNEKKKSIALIASKNHNNIIENSNSSSFFSSLLIMSIGAIMTGIMTGMMQLRIRKVLILLDSFHQHQINNNYFSVFIHLIGAIFVSIAYKFLKSSLYQGPASIVSESDSQLGGFNLISSISRLLACTLLVGTGVPLAFTGASVEMAMSNAKIISNIIKKILPISMHASKNEVKGFICACAAAGLAANFNSPLAGIFWANEISYHLIKSSSSSSSLLLSRLNYVIVATLCALSATFITSHGTFDPVSILGAATTTAPTSTTITTILTNLVTIFNMKSTVNLIFPAITIGFVMGLVSHGVSSGKSRHLSPRWNSIPSYTKLPDSIKPLRIGLLSLILFFKGVNLSLPSGFAIATRSIQTTTTTTTTLEFIKQNLLYASLWHALPRLYILLGAVGGLLGPVLIEGVTLGAGGYCLLMKYIPILKNIMSISTAAHLGGAALLAASFEAPWMAAALMWELTRTSTLCIPTIIACMVSNKVNKKLKDEMTK